jgi:hypothetical protein
MNEKMKKIFLENSKEITCTKCGKSWRIPNYKRRPPKRLIPKKCPYCNPLGITVVKKVPREIKLPGYGEIEIPPQTDLEKKTDEKWKKRNKQLLGQLDKIGD